MRLAPAYNYKRVENLQKFVLLEKALKGPPVKIWNWYFPDSLEAIPKGTALVVISAVIDDRQEILFGQLQRSDRQSSYRQPAMQDVRAGHIDPLETLTKTGFDKFQVGFLAGPDPEGPLLGIPGDGKLLFGKSHPLHVL